MYVFLFSFFFFKKKKEKKKRIWVNRHKAISLQPSSKETEKLPKMIYCVRLRKIAVLR